MPIGLIALRDTLRDDAREVLAALRALGVRHLVMLTGDHRNRAQAMAAEIGIDEVFAEQVPEDKAGVIEQLRAEGRRVAFVGDGVNDGPALVAADVGIAMSRGAELARATADVVLLEDRLGLLVDRSTSRSARCARGDELQGGDRDQHRRHARRRGRLALAGRDRCCTMARRSACWSARCAAWTGAMRAVPSSNILPRAVERRTDTMAFPLIPFVAGAVVGGLAAWFYRDDKVRAEVRLGTDRLVNTVKETGDAVSDKVSAGLEGLRRKRTKAAVDAAAAADSAAEAEAETGEPAPAKRRTSTRKTTARKKATPKTETPQAE
jgi:soluble P-type ATPase